MRLTKPLGGGVPRVPMRPIPMRIVLQKQKKLAERGVWSLVLLFNKHDFANCQGKVFGSGEGAIKNRQRLSTGEHQYQYQYQWGKGGVASEQALHSKLTSIKSTQLVSYQLRLAFLLGGFWTEKDTSFIH